MYTGRCVHAGTTQSPPSTSQGRHIKKPRVESWKEVNSRPSWNELHIISEVQRAARDSRQLLIITFLKKWSPFVPFVSSQNKTLQLSLKWSRRGGRKLKTIGLFEWITPTKHVLLLRRTECCSSRHSNSPPRIPILHRWSVVIWKRM